jgi:hypothetical protein
MVVVAPKWIRDRGRLKSIVSRIDYRLEPMGSEGFFLYVNAGNVSKRDWAWFRDRVLKPCGFIYVGQGQSEWFLEIRKQENKGDHEL